VRVKRGLAAMGLQSSTGDWFGEGKRMKPKRGKFQTGIH